MPHPVGTNVGPIARIGRSGGHGKIGSRRSAGSCDHPIGRMRLLRSVTTIDRMLQLNFFAASDAGRDDHGGACHAWSR